MEGNPSTASVDSHKNGIDPAPGITGDQAYYGAGDDGDDHGRGGDLEHSARAENQAAQHILAEAVGAEDMLGAGEGRL